MASVNKKAKTDKKNHPGRDRHFLKNDSKLKGVSFYNKKDRVSLNSEIDMEN